MYIENGIAHADDPTPAIRVSGVRPLDNYKLLLCFNNGEAKIFDFSPLLNEPTFIPLMDKAVFNQVYIDHGITAWNDGNIDISPQYLYEHSVPAAGIA